MSAAHPHPALDRTAVADEIDEVRRLVEVASMAVVDFGPGRPTNALRTLLELIDDKLCSLSETVLPGGGL